MKRSRQGGKKPSRKTLTELNIERDVATRLEASLSENESSFLPRVENGCGNFKLNFEQTKHHQGGSRVPAPFVCSCEGDFSTVRPLWQRFVGRRNVAVVISLFIHILLALILFSIVITVKVGLLGNAIEGSFTSVTEDLDLTGDSNLASMEETAFDVVSDEGVDNFKLTPQISEEKRNDLSVADQLSELDGASLVERETTTGLTGIDATGGGAPFFSSIGDASERGARKRGAQARGGDVTKESEDAVERGLDWLARHQFSDGGWAFDLTIKDDNGRELACRCSNSSGTSYGDGSYLGRLHPSRTAATAISLLPFLGSGHTHTEKGPYQRAVANGLRFLQYRAVVKEDGVDFRDGFVADGASYVQALVTVTFCEAYEMTKDENLRTLAEGGMRFIERSQLRDGGWRYYSIGDLAFHDTVDGDLSVLGWQMMALHSGVSAGFSLPASVAYRAGHFLDLVMRDHGRSYLYQPKKTPREEEDIQQRWGTTAVGVLMREYLGWQPGDDPNKKNILDRGARQIAEWISLADKYWQDSKKIGQNGRGKNRVIVGVREGRIVYNLYFAYYATLALWSYGGKLWEESFLILRSFLTETQGRSALLSLNQCEDGSWLFFDQYMNDGGRLLNTALAVLILETPYRYLPMYR